MKKLQLSLSASTILLAHSKSAIDPEDMSDEQLEEAFHAAKADIGQESDPIDTEQPEPENNDPIEDVIASEDSDLEDDPIIDEDPAEESEEPSASEDPKPEPNITYEDEFFSIVDGKTQFQPIKINGEEIPVENMQELYALGSKGGHFTQSMQEIAPYRRSVSAMKENDITEADINLYIEARNGNKDAMAAIMQSSGVDPLDVEETPSEGYAPKQYGQSTQQMAIQDIQRDLGRDPEFVTTQNIVDGQWDAASRTALAQDPEMIRGLHNDVKTGTYNVIAPQAAKLAAIDGYKSSSLEYYMEAGRRHFAVQDAENQRRSDPQTFQAPENVKQKRSARKPGGSSTKKPSVIDYLNMSDDEYDKMYKNIMDRA